MPGAGLWLAWPWRAVRVGRPPRWCP